MEEVDKFVILRVNERLGNWSKCTKCRKLPIEYKKCKGCGEDIKRQSNTSDYHTDYFTGIKLEKKGGKYEDYEGLMNYSSEDKFEGDYDDV